MKQKHVAKSGHVPPAPEPPPAPPARGNKSITMRPMATEPLDLSSLGALMEFSKIVASSDFIPREYKGKAENVALAIQLGADVGLSPVQAIQNIAVINARPAIWGDAALAIVRAHPEFVDIDEGVRGAGEDRVGYCTIYRRGKKPTARVFTYADAKKAKLTTKPGPWQEYQNRMLMLRARGFAIRDSFADALKGLNVREELEDFVDSEVVEVDGDQNEATETDSHVAALREKLAPEQELQVEKPEAETARADPKAPSAADLEAQIAEADSVDDFDLCLDLINKLPDFQTKKRLNELLVHRRREFAAD